jgi:hypothetical protein
MLRRLDPDPHGSRLRDLLHRFRAQAAGMQQALAAMATELERWQHEASRARLAGSEDGAPLLDRCRELQAEHDALAIELVHVRLAVAGTAEELADHELGRRSSAGAERLLTPA